MSDKMKIEILEDGTISVETDKISGTNHHSADDFLKEIKKLGGGSCETNKKKVAHSHIVTGQNIKQSH